LAKTEVGNPSPRAATTSGLCCFVLVSNTWGALNNSNRMYFPTSRMGLALALLSSQAHSFSVFPKLARRTSRIRSMTIASHSQSDAVVLFSSDKLEVLHLKKTVESTQDEAKRLLSDRVGDESSPPILAVIADNQSKGRGTSGRSWVASKGNLYLTCAVPMELIPMSKLTLLPLGCGIVIAEELVLHSQSRPTLKWPNDVLLDGLKIAGTLIENHRTKTQDWWLIGIGVNIESHPEELPKETDDALDTPRSAVSLRSHSSQSPIPTALQLGVSLTKGLQSFTELLQSQDASSIVGKWKSYADLKTLYTIRNTGETVQIIDIQLDGQLKVLGEDGRERLLVADYFH
jgi:biotin-[acetyl-CoA-carboxylase] ligase BirA-like protein